MSSRENKQLIRQLHEQGYPAGAEAVDRFFAEDYVDHSAWGDRDGLKATLEAFHQSYPNASWIVQDIVAEGDKVAVRSVVEIRTAGGVARAIGSTAIYRIANGKIVEQWGHGDRIF